MRPNRRDQLFADEGVIHQIVRVHNKEFLFERNQVKYLYFSSWARVRQRYHQERTVKLHAFAFMDNHLHTLIGYSKGSSSYSSFIQKAHTSFAMGFNRLLNRSGRMANDRPKTCLIQDLSYEMKAHFYIEANPIRIGKHTVDSLRRDKFNSYRFYAYGELDEITANIEPVQWYLDLAATPSERQKIYRKMFADYLGSDFKSIQSQKMQLYYIGDDPWTDQMYRKLLLKMTSKEPIGQNEVTASSA